MTHRYRVYPSIEQGTVLSRHCDHARFVWNLALEQANCWRAGRAPTPDSAARMRQLAEARQGTFLAEGSSSVQQQALRDFDRALHNWWAGTRGHPKWRKRGRGEGFCVRDVTVARLNRRWAEVTVPKAGRVRFRLCRPLPPGKLGIARVTLDGKGRWHISFPAPQAALARSATGRVVGIDRGVATTLATSDGHALRAPVMTQRQQRRLADLQRQLSRQTKCSRRREQTKRRVSRLHQAVADRRRNWIERTTTRLIRDYDLVAVERLNVKAMVRRPRPRPDPARPGAYLPNGARAKAGLNRSIHAQGWGMWLRRLREKAKASGVAVISVDPRHTSDECRACGHTEPANRESQAVFRCQACGHEGHADLEAAMKILARALRLAPTPGSGATEKHSVPASTRRTESAVAGTSPEAA